MARARMIRPEFWTDEKVGLLTHTERLLFIGMWNYADDEGLIKANPLYLKASIFPYDNFKIEELEKALDKFSKLKLILVYAKNNQKYAWIIKFRKHQRIDKPQKPTNPVPALSFVKQSVFYRDDYICHICGTETDPTQPSNISGSRVPSIDHLIPQSKNGDHRPSNLACACLTCNKSRGNNDLPDSEIILGTFQENSGINQEESEIVPDQVKLKEVNLIEDNTPLPPKRGRGPVYSQEFETFYEAYPKKVAKPEAWKSWQKQKQSGILPENGKVIAAIEEQKKSDQWRKDGGQFIPNPATWLNQGRWDDKLQASGEGRAW